MTEKTAKTTKTTKTAKTEQKADGTTPKAPRRGIGTVAREVIRAGGTNEEALEAVQKEFPEATTKMASINWYRNDERKKDPSIPLARELNKAAREKAKAEAAAKAEADGTAPAKKKRTSKKTASKPAAKLGDDPTA